MDFQTVIALATAASKVDPAKIARLVKAAEEAVAALKDVENDPGAAAVLELVKQDFQAKP